LVILEDTEGDGRFETRTVFIEGLNLVSGFELGYGGVWVGAAPELLFIPDHDRDDRPDGPPKVLLDGFGYQDTHECLNSFLWGPDGWLYGIQGVFNLAHIGKPGSPDDQRQELRAGVWRYHPTRHQFEIFAHGGSNPWGLDFDAQGQLFMTHCRSYWGKGATTHVIQGGHFWNQANANYAPFIVADPPSTFPGFRNYLLASARYDHGAGGAGLPGSDAIYGGHSHVGTLIYQGDNWPEEYRGRLFTHNLHGHQINQQVNRPWGSGFDTVHAGRDLFFCTDPKYIDPNAVIGTDFQVATFDLTSGDVVSGLVLQETSSAVTIRTTTEEQVLAKSAIAERQQSELSLMPEGLLEALGPRERIELLKYLIEH
jgi:putative membrane-bound dehydrogenase-like protein